MPNLMRKHYFAKHLVIVCVCKLVTGKDEAVSKLVTGKELEFQDWLQIMFFRTYPVTSFENPFSSP
jgi:hypothetical protein